MIAPRLQRAFSHERVLELQQPMWFELREDFRIERDFPLRAVKQTIAERWIWLFPVTYLAHIAEEFWAPPTFYRWDALIPVVGFLVSILLRG